MALRHPVPKFELAQFGAGEGKVVARVPPPVKVQFARGGGEDEFLAMARKYDDIEVLSALSSGKSVRMPPLLLSLGCPLVLHLVPSRNLAGDIAAFVSSKHPGKPIHFCDLGQECPSSGLVLMSTSQYAWTLTKWLNQEGQVRDHIVYLDECHESDWVTVTLRALRCQLPGVVKFFQATATKGTGATGEEFDAPAVSGKLTTEQYSVESPLEWDVEDFGKPWSAVDMQSDSLVFIDDPHVAATVTERFAEAGVAAVRLTARTPYATYKAVKDTMVNRRAGMPLTVMIADYSYRFGFTFPTVTRVVDNADVAFVLLREGGSWSYSYRRAFRGELAQTSARGAIRVGGNCVYYRPDYEPVPAVVDVEGGEADAVPILYRMLGFRPPKAFASTPFYSGGLPASVGRVLMGDTPLRMYSGKRVDWPGAASAPPVNSMPVSAYTITPPASPKPIVGERVGIRGDEFGARGGQEVLSDCESDGDLRAGRAGGVSGRGAFPRTQRRDGAGEQDGLLGDPGESFQGGRGVRRGGARGGAPAVRPPLKPPFVEGPAAAVPEVLLSNSGRVRAAVPEPGEDDEVGNRVVRSGRQYQHDVELIDGAKHDPVVLKLGRYYHFPGSDYDFRAKYPGGFIEVLKVWGSPDLIGLLPTAASDVQRAVAACALLACNEASVTVTAARQAMEETAGLVFRAQVDPVCAEQWRTGVGATHDRHVATFKAARELVRVLRGDDVMEVDGYADIVRGVYDNMMRDLRTRATWRGVSGPGVGYGISQVAAAVGRYGGQVAYPGVGSYRRRFIEEPPPITCPVPVVQRLMPPAVPVGYGSGTMPCNKVKLAKRFDSGHGV